MTPYIANGAENHPGPGPLTYRLQQVINNYLRQRRIAAGTIRYQDLSDCLGALEGAKLDFHERVLRPFESRKNLENGEVWDDLLLKKIHGEPR